jgi:uncharacterized membrane protein
MNLLNIWHSGGVTEALLAFAVLISGIFWYQAYKGSRSGSQQQDLKKGTQYSDQNISIFKLPTFWLGVAVWVLVLLAIIFIVAPDYKGV